MLYLRAVLAALCAVASFASLNDISFSQFVKRFNKPYKLGSDEWLAHEAVFERNVKEIVAHNALYDKKLVSYFREVNKFTDMDDNDMKSSFGHAGAQHSLSANPTYVLRPGMLKGKEIPPSKNWVEEGIVTPVKDQGNCGSCWAFSTIGLVESYLARDEGVFTELSVEQLVDCMANPNECGGQGGCQGATTNLALDYLMEAGVMDGWSYPYSQYFNSQTNLTYECQYNKLVGYDKTVLNAKVEGYVMVQPNSYQALMEAIAQGPVAVSIDASTWKSYGGGVFTGCHVDNTINHGVLLVGYGTDEESGLDYWLIRNSWGPYWGEKGYIRIQRIDPSKGQETPCGWDYSPLDGTACKDDAPDKLYVCGTCGILWDSSYPTAVRLYSEDDKKHDDDDDEEKIGTLTRGAFAGVMVAVAVAAVGGGYFIYRKRQESPEATHQLMKD